MKKPARECCAGENRSELCVLREAVAVWGETRLRIPRNGQEPLFPRVTVVHKVTELASLRAEARILPPQPVAHVGIERLTVARQTGDERELARATARELGKIDGVITIRGDLKITGHQRPIETPAVCVNVRRLMHRCARGPETVREQKRLDEAVVVSVDEAGGCVVGTGGRRTRVLRVARRRLCRR